MSQAEADIRTAIQQLASLGGSEFVQEMIDLLKTQTPDQFAQIEMALANNDLATAQRLAHSMKSTFGSFGATECQQLATAMDLAGKQGKIEDYRIEFQNLRDAFARFQRILNKSFGD